MSQLPPAESPDSPPLHVDLAQVCSVDGIWQDMPDQIAAFDEARLGASVSGRGSLYVLLDVSGEIEGRAEVERELIETVRREYVDHHGSITFGLSEALRAANAALYDLNLAAAREARRMAGISAVVLRGQDLYVAQAGPAVVYAEIDDLLHRFPAESEWFTEDQPVISPGGKASAPLGLHREFACDLFHTPVRAGDVFVLATRALTQLASTEELAQAFTNRGAEDIGSFLEQVANGSDLSALVAELVDPRDLDKAGPPAPVTQMVPEFSLATQPLEPETAATETEPPRAETMAAAAETAAPEESTQQELERRREERRRQRAAQIGAVWRVLGGVGVGLVGLVALLGRAVLHLVDLVDWEGLKGQLNRLLNMLFTAVWRLLALLVRLVLPGAPSKQPVLLPRRASREPLWLRGVAVLLPVIFIGLAFGIYKQQDLGREKQAADLVASADRLEQAAENNPDKNAAREQLDQALVSVRQARDLYDTPNAQNVFFKIQDQLNEVSGIAVLYVISPLATLKNGGADFSRVIADGNDLYLLDRGAQRVYHYIVNDSATSSQPSPGDGTILKVGDKADTISVGAVRGLVWADSNGSTTAGLVAVSDNALLQYDPPATSWHATVVSDAAQWGQIRAVASFLGNVYLLDAAKNQIWKYVPAANGYAQQAVPYLPANSSTSFSRAVDLAVDGDVWVLTADGSVLRFRGGQRVPYDLSGLETPLKNPVSLYTQAEVDAVYIADAGNQRLVEFDKSGKFVRAFKPAAQNGDAFNSLEALLASDAERKFYFVNGSTLYVANLPR
jgi:serine/threonine protein phosphatase PrpC